MGIRKKICSEISTNGKSRAFVNDTPVNLEQLRILSSMLVDLHRQFDTLVLGESDFQREVIDALASNAQCLHEYQEIFKQLQHNRIELAALLERKNSSAKEYDFKKFLFDELEEASFRENELEELEAELKLLSNSEGIKATLTKVSFQLNESEEPIVQQLKIIHQQLSTIASFHPDLGDIMNRMQSAQIELQDIADEIERVNDHVSYDPNEIEKLNERISMGYRLLKKHGVKTTNELLAIQHRLDKDLQSVLNIDEEIFTKQNAVDVLLKEAIGKAGILSERRKKQLKPLQEKVNQLLTQVGMPNARIKVEVNPLQALGGFGNDTIDFLFDANKSNRFEQIRKVASGGELSRLMLSIKSLVAQSMDLPTMIFDEIDSGISGEAAKQVGIIMKGLAGKRQVISITHQPQIAGKADAHFFVFKEIRGEAIKTNIRLLSKDERITTIAKMLSGEKPTAAAIENAREMLMN